MEILYFIVLLALFASMLCSLIRTGLGPTWFDRAISVNAFTTKIILTISVYLFATGHPQYIDIALLYGLINYVGTLALINCLNRRVAAKTPETAND